MQALSLTGLRSESDYCDTLRTLFAKDQHQFKVFDSLYLEFKDQVSRAVDAKIKTLAVPKPKPSKVAEVQFESLKNWLNLSSAQEEVAMAAPSSMEILGKKHFTELSGDEMRLMMRLLQKMARYITHEKSRLRKLTKKKGKLDVRSTVKAGMRKGGEMSQFLFSSKKERPLRLVLLCDVSRSMELYSRFLIHLVYAFQHAHDRIEAFVFSTALHRISDMLSLYGPTKAFDIISDRVPQWSGGTTIGSCLTHFQQEHGHRYLDRKTVVLIISDGWDTGEREVMARAMAYIHKNAKKVIWLNPLSGNPDFSPEAMGLKTAMPYIDHLAPAHNLESLKRAFQQISKRRHT